MAANRGQFSPVPVDQAIAYLVEILPAFSYLHSLGLLYCDFKPANMIQVGDGLKLIDLGGVRRADDDISPIYGTVGFQAPEVPRDGCSVASDVYTVARTLAVIDLRVQGLPDEVPRRPARAPTRSPIFAEHDSLYRWLLKGTAPSPEDRFQSAEEMRDQLLGVLRDVTAQAAGAVTRSTPSHLFETPAVAGEELSWNELPRLTASADDPMAAVPGQRHGHRARGADAGLRPCPRAVHGGPRGPGLHGARAASAGHGPGGRRTDPHGGPVGVARCVAAGSCRAAGQRRAVRGERVQRRVRATARRAGTEAGVGPGVRARRRDGGGPTDVRPVRAQRRGVRRAGAVRHRPPRGELRPARRGVGRAGAHPGHEPGLRRRPPPARRAARGDDRRRPRPRRPRRGGHRAGPGVDGGPGAQRPAHQILGSALDFVRRRGADPRARIAGSTADEPSLRRAMEQAYRDAARLNDDPRERVRLVDRANDIRPRSVV